MAGETWTTGFQDAHGPYRRSEPFASRARRPAPSSRPSLRQGSESLWHIGAAQTARLRGAAALLGDPPYRSRGRTRRERGASRSVRVVTEPRFKALPLRAIASCSWG